MTALAHSPKAALEAAHRRDAKHRDIMKRLQHSLIRKAGITLTAATYGAMRRHSVPLAIKSFPWKVGVWFGSTLVEAMTKGGVQAVAGAISDTTMASYTENAIATGSLIAGDGNGVGAEGDAQV